MMRTPSRDRSGLARILPGVLGFMALLPCPLARARVDESAGQETYIPVTFARLASFPYREPLRSRVAGPRDPLPSEVLTLNGKKVCIRGFMTPLSAQGGKIDHFILSRAVFGCCYGDSPKMNEMIQVTMAEGKGADYRETVEVLGVLEVGEDVSSDGYVQSLYRMRADVVREIKGEDPWLVDLVLVGIIGCILFLVGRSWVGRYRQLRGRPLPQKEAAVAAPPS